MYNQNDSALVLVDVQKMVIQTKIFRENELSSCKPEVRCVC